MFTSPTLPMTLFTVFSIITILFVTAPPHTTILASSGDNSSEFRTCTNRCYASCYREDKLYDLLHDHYIVTADYGDSINLNITKNEKYAQLLANLTEYIPFNASIPAENLTNQQRYEATITLLEEELRSLQSWYTFDLWFFRWDCHENCRYMCMQEQTAEIYQKIAKDPVNYSRTGDLHKYYGKWPFFRIFGIQEFCSTLFSMFNFIPFYQYFFTILDELPQTYYMRYIWFGYTMSGMNTWIWSTAFHARDTILTERFDYFCATFSILYLLNIAIIRIFLLKKVKHWLCVIIPTITYFSWHCYTLHYIHFDYGWNMTMMVIFGSCYCLLWYFWAFMNKSASHRWKICIANTIILVMSGFEVFDFPPIFQILDAHAIWHFSTPLCTYLTFSFAIDDAQYLHQLTMKSKEFSD